MVPVPEVNSIAELNEMVDQWDLQDEIRRVGAWTRTVGEHFAIEQPLLRPVPDESFKTGVVLSPRVDRFSEIGVHTNH
jgi:hypothetical protein